MKSYENFISFCRDDLHGGLHIMCTHACHVSGTRRSACYASNTFQEESDN